MIKPNGVQPRPIDGDSGSSVWDQNGDEIGKLSQVPDNIKVVVASY